MDNSFDINKVKLRNIVITNASIENKTELTTIDKKSYERKFSYGFGASADIDGKRLKIIFQCKMVIEKKTDKNEPIDISANFEVTYTFSIENLQELAKLEDEYLNINDDLLIGLFNIAYSTSRGVIYTRCQGTIIEEFILPILPDSRLAELVR